MEAQRQELMAGFDDAQCKREHEFRKKADDLSNSLLTSELKVRVLLSICTTGKVVYWLHIVHCMSPLSDMIFMWDY